MRCRGEVQGLSRAFPNWDEQGGTKEAALLGANLSTETPLQNEGPRLAWAWPGPGLAGGLGMHGSACASWRAVLAWLSPAPGSLCHHHFIVNFTSPRLESAYRACCPVAPAPTRLACEGLFQPFLHFVGPAPQHRSRSTLEFVELFSAAHSEVSYPHLIILSKFHPSFDFRLWNSNPSSNTDHPATFSSIRVVFFAVPELLVPEPSYAVHRFFTQLICYTTFPAN